MNGKKRVTLKELMAITGLSRTTLYNVLNDKGNFSEETKKRVYEAMEEYDYHPNLNARNLARRQPTVVGYVGIYSDETPYYNRAVQLGLSRAVRRFEDHGLELLPVLYRHTDETGFLTGMQSLYDQGVRNFILFASVTPAIQDAAADLIAKGCTVVALSNNLNSEGLLAYAGCSYRQSGLICAELAEKFVPPNGKVLPVCHKALDTDGAVTGRLRAFYDALKQNGIAVLPPLYLNQTPLSDAVLDEKIKASGVSVVADILGDIGGLCDYLDRRDLAGQVRLLCFDVHDEIIPHIQSGCIDAVVHQSLENEAYLAVKLLFEAVCYHKLPEKRNHYAPLSIVLKSNLSYYTV